MDEKKERLDRREGDGGQEGRRWWIGGKDGLGRRGRRGG